MRFEKRLKRNGRKRRSGENRILRGMDMLEKQSVTKVSLFST